MKRRRDGTIEYDNEKKPGKVERALVQFVALFIIFPFAMLGLLIFKLLWKEDWLAEKIMKFNEERYPRKYCW